MENIQFKIIRNDITNIKAGALVLPANSGLREGSGTSKAIFEKAGRKELTEACKNAKKEYGKLSAGEVVVTQAFGLSVDFIIHAIVPVWKGGKYQEYEQLSAVYLSALKVSDIMGCESIAFPLLGSGNNGFDRQLAFEIAKESITSFKQKRNLHTVYLVVYDLKTMIMLWDLNIFAEEQIDDNYVFEKDESYNQVSQKFAEGTKAAQGFLDDGIEAAKKYILNSENRKIIFTQGARIAREVLEGVSNKEPLGSKQYVYDEKMKEEVLNPGDVIGVSRGIYEHYAIYTGNDEVIHYAGENGDFGGQKSIHRATLKEFLAGASEFFVMGFLENVYAFSPEKTIERAESRLGESKYDPIRNNCEHFAIWCKTGISESYQVEVAQDILKQVFYKWHKI